MDTIVIGQGKLHELRTLEWDTFNPDWLIRISNVEFEYSTEKSKTGFKSRKSLPFLYIDFKWHLKFKISRFLIHDSDWLNFLHFSGYKYKNRLVSRLRKKEDQALISISTILMFPALKPQLLW